MSDTITIAEKYTSATHASNLRVEADRPGPADIIIAAGMSPSRLGAALLRLHSEWDSMPKHKVMTDTDMMLLMMRLKSLRGVCEQLSIVADKMGMKRDVAHDVLAWWLNRVCPSCHGQQREVIPNTPVLSDVVCPVCRGSGEAKLPHGQAGRKIEAYINDAINAARQSIKRRLRG